MNEVSSEIKHKKLKTINYIIIIFNNLLYMPNGAGDRIRTGNPLLGRQMP